MDAGPIHPGATSTSRQTSRIYQDLEAYSLLPSTDSNHEIESLIKDTHEKTMVESSSDTIYNSLMSIALRSESLESRIPRIGIVGGGISGLRCADLLLKSGFYVTILEARDRLGGRACQTTTAAGHVIDLGPNWVHGTDGNPILDLAKQTDTALHSWKDENNMFDETGRLLADGRALHDIMWGIVVQAFRYSEEHSSSIPPEKSLHDYFLEKVKVEIPDGDDHERKRNIVLQIAELWGGYVGSPITKQSLKFFWLEECINGENLFCAGTFTSIVEEIARAAVKEADIKLSTKIISIETVDNGVRLMTESGDSFEFDEVVITVPLGWLKRNKQSFKPELPTRFSKAIDSIGYGCLEKVFITFPKAFWLENSVEREEQTFTGFVEWLSPIYASETNSQRWCQESVDLSTLPGSCAHPTLLFYIFGDQSIEISKTLAALSSQEEKDNYIIKSFKPYFSRLPHFVEGDLDCTPISCIATNWIADEFAGWGSYSTFRTGLTDADTDIEVMREGLPARGLWFAGEHTAPFIAMGTVTGAYWSGETVAKRIAAAYGKLLSDASLVAKETTGNSVAPKEEVNIRGFIDVNLERP